MNSACERIGCYTDTCHELFYTFQPHLAHFSLSLSFLLIHRLSLLLSFSSFLFSTEEQCLPSDLLLLISNKFSIKNDLHWNILQLNALELNINTSSIQMLTRKTYRKWARCEPMMGGVGGWTEQIINRNNLSYKVYMTPHKITLTPTISYDNTHKYPFHIRSQIRNLINNLQLNRTLKLKTKN